jgi:very-short-patch-repair endonuclease
MKSLYEVQLKRLLQVAGLEPFEEEYRFARELGRAWRFDFAWPAELVGVEIDGGARVVRWQRNPRTGKAQPVAVGRHATRKDYEKTNAAAALGWRVLRFTPDMLPQAAATVGSVLLDVRATREADRILARSKGCCFAGVAQACPIHEQRR